ncbi:amidase family protein [Peribacillus frigoritolerans]|uniref:amidase n=1 Tax=Peribacillus frigoritolerans TaxID=450367 RepID=UPI0021AA365B|nr:amidase [Peribacillus frigoritolerans]MCT4477301.1 amidase family protein [Peribacillus frigoritolerans]
MEATYKDEILQWDLFKLSNAIYNKQISPVEVTGHIIERISQVNPKINAYITVLEDQAIKDAKQAEKEITMGNWRGPLHGIPIGVKDMIYTKNIKTTMGSELFKNFLPDYNATVVEKLKRAGAIIIGKQNTHEFAYGPTGDRSYFGPVRNPYDLSKMTGGSSSGSAAAVASALCYGALGTDTGGSVRIPSSICGIVGMKPTFGRVSKYGLYPTSWTLDHIGPMTRCVKDNAILLNVLSEYDSQDYYSIKTTKEDFTRLLNKGIKGSVIGIPSSFFFERVESEVKNQVFQAIEVFKSLGAEVRQVNIPQIQKISLAHQMIVKCEAYTIHESPLDNSPELYDTEVKERLLSGSIPKALEYVKALQMKQVAIHEFNQVLEKVDVILFPTVSVLPPDIEQREVTIDGHPEHVRSAINRLNGPTNLNGFPSLQIPCGFSSSGIPIGLQLIGKQLDEANLYRFAHSFEQEVSLPTVKMNI